MRIITVNQHFVFFCEDQYAASQHFVFFVKIITLNQHFDFFMRIITLSQHFVLFVRINTLIQHFVFFCEDHYWYIKSILIWHWFNCFFMTSNQHCQHFVTVMMLNLKCFSDLWEPRLLYALKIGILNKVCCLCCLVFFYIKGHQWPVEKAYIIGYNFYGEQDNHKFSYQVWQEKCI